MTTDWPKLVEISQKYNDRYPTKNSIGRSIQVPNSIAPSVDLDQVLEVNYTNLVEDKDFLMGESRSGRLMRGWFPFLPNPRAEW